MRIKENRIALLRLSAMAGALLLSISSVWKIIASFDFIALGATIVGGYPMAKEAFDAARKRRMSMELSMSIAVLATLIIGQFLTGLVITLFVLIAELLEHLTVSGGREVIKALTNLLPQCATVRRNGIEEEVECADLRRGDTVIVKPGAKVPVDGNVLKGSSYVDQSSITGESLPVEKLDGDSVYAGTINQSGVLEVETRSVGVDTTFGKIVEIIEKAENSRAPIQKVANRLAAWLVYFAFGGAVITFAVTHNITAAISALVVAGACGVAAGTPLAILAGIGRTAKEGIIVKGGIHLEQLAKVDTVLLDKTGTLTLGMPNVVGYVNFDGVGHDALQLAATAEQHSGHPLATAISNKAKELGYQIPSYSEIKYLPGRGVICRTNGNEIAVGNKLLMEERSVKIDSNAEEYIEQNNENAQTIVLVARDKQMIGGINIADVLRDDSIKAVEELRKLGCRVVLLTGDSWRTARAVAKSLSVDEVFGEMLPEQKLLKVREYLGKGNCVAMVGDGINDAAAIVEATVGIAMGAGTDVALESAGMVLMTNNLTKIVEAIRISRHCIKVIMFNFWGTVLVDAAGVVLAFLKFLNPLYAALIHVGSETAFILNSARLFRRQ